MSNNLWNECLVSNPRLSCGERENIYFGIPALFIQPGQRTQHKEAAVSAQKEQDPVPENFVLTHTTEQAKQWKTLEENKEAKEAASQKQSGVMQVWWCGGEGGDLQSTAKKTDIKSG